MSGNQRIEMKESIGDEVYSGVARAGVMRWSGGRSTPRRTLMVSGPAQYPQNSSHSSASKTIRSKV